MEIINVVLGNTFNLYRNLMEKLSKEYLIISLKLLLPGAVLINQL